MSLQIGNINSNGFLAANASINVIRDPKNTDASYSIGQIWINTATQTVFTLVAFNVGVPVWQVTGGGPEFLTSLTVNPGPTSLTGNLTVNGGVVNINSNQQIALQSSVNAANAIILDASDGGIDIGTSTTLGAIAIADVIPTVNRNLVFGGGNIIEPVTETINIGTGGLSNAGAVRTVNIATGVAVGASDQTVNIGTDDGLSVINITGSINLNTGAVDNSVKIGHINETIVSPAVAITNDTRVGTILMSGYTTAATSSIIIVLTNVFIVTGNECILATVTNGGNNDAQMSLTAIITTANTAAFHIFNAGTQALNGNAQINFWIMS